MNAATTKTQPKHKAEGGKLKAEKWDDVSATLRERADFGADLLRRSRIVHAANRVNRFERLAVQGLTVLFQLGEKVEELSGAGAALVGPSDPECALFYQAGVDPARLCEDVSAMISEGCGKIVVHVAQPVSSPKGGQAK